MRDILDSIVGANKAMGAVTVVLVQILKMYLPSDPDAPVGEGRFTVDPTYKKYLLLASFVIGTMLTVLLAPVQNASLRVQISNGLQTGAYAVVFWEIYSNLRKSLVSGSSG